MKLPITIYLYWLRLAWFIRKHFGTKTYGLGWSAARVGAAFSFQFNGLPFLFLPRAARSYCLLPAGIPNEPETHKFLSRVLARSGGGVTFIDIGASIGEFAITMAHHDRVHRVIAFEPHPATADALRASANLCHRANIDVIEKGVGATTGFATFNLNDIAPTGAGLRSSDANKPLAQIPLCTLDETIAVSPCSPLIVLIDIEGGELDALRGGQNLIARGKPLIIFEYNATTRKFFQISRAQELLGDGYTIYRLRSEDGLLDNDLTSTWNVVALPHQCSWQHLKQQKELFSE